MSWRLFSLCLLCHWSAPQFATQDLKIPSLPSSLSSLEFPHSSLINQSSFFFLHLCWSHSRRQRSRRMERSHSRFVAEGVGSNSGGSEVASADLPRSQPPFSPKLLKDLRMLGLGFQFLRSGRASTFLSESGLEVKWRRMSYRRHWRILADS